MLVDPEYRRIWQIDEALLVGEEQTSGSARLFVCADRQHSIGVIVPEFGNAVIGGQGAPTARERARQLLVCERMTLQIAATG